MILLDIESGSGPRQVDLLAYLEPAQEERAQDDAYAWIKAVRHVRVEGEPFRSRFTMRGDSLWWFAELYLHKEQAILNALRALSAFETLVERERPIAVSYKEGPYAGVIAHAARSRKLGYAGPEWRHSTRGLIRMEARASTLAAGARLSRLRLRAAPGERVRIAAFVHRAFWRSGGADGGAESYIGPVLRELEARVTPPAVRYVGVGPRSNFRARRWWDAIATDDDTGTVPIERYAPASALAASRAVYRDRHRIRRLMWNSADLRAHAVIRGCDCWPLVRHQLAGVALLQFPWSARAMDEAAAALDALQPEAAVTYAEAGGWGRAIALECRRRRIPLAGLQHGFIYRHWLNYRHEPDETVTDAVNGPDTGFPFPAATLLFDDRTASYLADSGRFPSATLQVTGSARLDEMQAAVATLGQQEIESARRQAGADRNRALLVLCRGKEREARGTLPALIAAVRGDAGRADGDQATPGGDAGGLRSRGVGGAERGGAAGVRAAAAPARGGARHRHRQLDGRDRRAHAGRAVPGRSACPTTSRPLSKRADGGRRQPGRNPAALARVLYDQEFRSRIERSRSDRLRAAADGRRAIGGGHTCV